MKSFEEIRLLNAINNNKAGCVDNTDKTSVPCSKKKSYNQGSDEFNFQL